MSIDADRTETEALEAVNSIYQDLSEGADFEVLAKELSDDAEVFESRRLLGFGCRGVFAPDLKKLCGLWKKKGLFHAGQTEFGYHHQTR